MGTVPGLHQQTKALRQYFAVGVVQDVGGDRAFPRRIAFFVCQYIFRMARVVVGVGGWRGDWNEFGRRHFDFDFFVVRRRGTVGGRSGACPFFFGGHCVRRVCGGDDRADVVMFVSWIVGGEPAAKIATLSTKFRCGLVLLFERAVNALANDWMPCEDTWTRPPTCEP